MAPFGNISAPGITPLVNGYPVEPFSVYFNDRMGGLNRYLLLIVLVGDRVVESTVFNVVVGRYSALTVGGIFIGFPRQRAQSRPVKGKKNAFPASRPFLERPIRQVC